MNEPKLMICSIRVWGKMWWEVRSEVDVVCIVVSTVVRVFEGCLLGGDGTMN